MNIDDQVLLCAPWLVPVVTSLILLLLPSRYSRSQFAFMLTGLAVSILTIFEIVTEVWNRKTLTAFHGWLFVDALSAFHLLLLAGVFLATSVFSYYYFAHDEVKESDPPESAKRFWVLWLLSFAGMALVLVSNNLGMMWVGLETTTLVTAFLICYHKDKGALEAMWKYLIICSVGVAFALLGTLFLGVGAEPLATNSHDLLKWTFLRDHIAQMDPALVKVAFVFLLVGYGTKAGLAPMHTWLPDAHSQAPAPVSALFSGFMLSLALYAVMRVVSLVSLVESLSAWANTILICLGIFSLLIATGFIVLQKNVKRLLAYSSIEHIGLVTLALGFGPVGSFVALFHTLNHSVCKTLAFLAAGRIGQIYHTHKIKEIRDILHISPAWGFALLASGLALIGMVPFPIFLSKILLVKMLIQNDSWFVLVVFLLATTIIFIEFLRYLIHIAWNEERRSQGVFCAAFGERLLIAFFIVTMVGLGLAMPDAVYGSIQAAAQVLFGSEHVVSWQAFGN